jgi:hypothetical protein
LNNLKRDNFWCKEHEINFVKLFKIIYPNKFTLFMESEVPEKLRPGLYYVCGDYPELKPYIEERIKIILKEEYIAPAGNRTSISFLNLFKNYISKDPNLLDKVRNQMTYSNVKKLQISKSKMDYYYDRNINPIKVKYSDTQPIITLWGIKLNYSFYKVNRIPEIVALMTIAHEIISGATLDEIYEIINQLMYRRFIYKGQVVDSSESYINIELTYCTTRIIYYKFSITEWKELYNNLTKTFIK